MSDIKDYKYSIAKFVDIEYFCNEVQDSINEFYTSKYVRPVAKYSFGHGFQRMLLVSQAPKDNELFCVHELVYYKNDYKHFKDITDTEVEWFTRDQIENNEYNTFTSK